MAILNRAYPCLPTTNQSASPSSPHFQRPYVSRSCFISKRNSPTVLSNSLFRSRFALRRDSHSFSPKPDEATGPFPEAILLRERNVEEDGMPVPEFADDEERQLFEDLNLQLESDLNVERMRHYEVVYLIHENHDQETEMVNMKVQEFIQEKKGKIWRFSDWGMRRLAYKIQKANRAHYILMNFELEAKWINDLKSLLDKDNRVIRHLVMKRDTAETEDCPPPPEFNTLRAGFDDDEYDEEEEEEEDDDDDDEDWDDEGDNSDVQGVIYVDDEVDDGVDDHVNANTRSWTHKPEKLKR